jgi:flagellar hook-length control protein FliK
MSSAGTTTKNATTNSSSSADNASKIRSADTKSTKNTKSANTAKSTDNTKSAKAAADSSKDSLQTQAVSENAADAVENKTPLDEVSEAELQGISDEVKQLVEEGIKNVVQEDLGISDEQLEDAMSALALSYLDLMNQDNVKALTMYVNQMSDISDVLMNDDVSTVLTQVMLDLNVENVAKEAEVPVSQVQDLVSQQNEVLSSDELPVVTQTTQEQYQSVEILPETEEAVNTVQSFQTENTQENEVVTQQEDASQSVLPEVSVVKEETGTSDSSFFKGDQKSSQNQEELAQNMVDNIATATVTEEILPDGTVTMTTVEMRQIVVQVVQQIKVVIGSDQTNMQMTLNPEHLGKLQLMLTSKDGVMTANFTVQNEMVRHALEAQMQDLRDAFEEQGLKVEAVEVTVSTFEFTQSDQTGEGGQQSEKKKQNKELIDTEDAFWNDEESDDSEEKAVAAISGTGHNVNYTA